MKVLKVVKKRARGVYHMTVEVTVAEYMKHIAEERVADLLEELSPAHMVTPSYAPSGMVAGSVITIGEDSSDLWTVKTTAATA